MRMRVIINGSAGTAIGMSHAQLAEAIEAPLKSAGHEIAFEIVSPHELEDAVARAKASESEAVVIGGGDGSVRSAAIALTGTAKVLGIIPLGTMNLLARDLGIPFSLSDAVAALGIAAPSNIDMARVNDRTFLCASVVGLVTQYSAERQKLRGKPWYQRLPAYAGLIGALLASRHRLAVAIDDGRAVTVIRALSVGITCNDYDATSGLMLKRSQLDGQSLTLYASKHRSGSGMLLAVFRILMGLGWDDPQIAKLTGNRFTISTRRRRMWLANDGELEHIETPLVYSVLPGALKVLKPPQADQRTARKSFSARDGADRVHSA